MRVGPRRDRRGYTSYFTNLTLDVHHGFGTSAYDFGFYDQGVWLMSRFKAPFVR